MRILPFVARAPQGRRLTPQDDTSLPDVLERAGESGEDVFSAERILIGKQVHGAVFAIGDCAFAAGVDDPLRNQGRLREALETITRVEQIDPSGSAAPQQRAQVLFESGRAREAAVLFDSIARASFPQLGPRQIARHRSWNLVHYASALAAAGDTGSLSALADTLEWWGRRSAYGRGWRLHHHVRGLLLAARGELEPAAAELRRAIYSPTAGYTRTNLALANVLLRLGRPSEAVAVLQSALRGGIEGSSLYVTQTELHRALGRAWEAAGRPDSAVVQYRQVLTAWRDADPVFRARRDSVRARLTALSGSH